MKSKLFLLIFLTLSNWSMAKKLEKATLGGGCFWCTEAVYLQLKGVVDVKPGFSGGNIKNPNYNDVISETTGHAEVVQIKYNPEIISFIEIMEVFFLTHDPTTLNRQGYDIGTQYRSAIFYHNEEQKKIAENVIKAFEKEKIYDEPIVTEVTKFDLFYLAEDYHVNYFARNKNQVYCQLIIVPKMDKFRMVFKDKLQ